jgi:hypothetical protein
MFTDLKMQNAMQIAQSNLKKEEDEKRKRRARIEIIRDHLNASRANLERAGDDLRTAEEHLETTRKFAKTDAGNPGRVAEAIQHFRNLRAVEHAVGSVGERLKQYFFELTATIDRLKATVTALQQPDATWNTDASAEHARERMR